MVPVCFGLPLSFKIPCCSWIIVLCAVRFFYVFEQQLSQFYACSPILPSQLLLICNSSVMARLLFSSCLTAATDAIQQLQFCCFLSLSQYLIGTYAEVCHPVVCLNYKVGQISVKNTTINMAK